MSEGKYSEYIKKLTSYWAHNSVLEQNGSGNILVDLIHDNIKYLFFNLNLAKYLQCNLGGDIHGVTGNWPTVLNDYDTDVCLDLSGAFGLKDLLKINSAQLNVTRVVNSFRDRLSPIVARSQCSLAELLFIHYRALLNVFSEDEVELLQINYDYTLRDNLLPTIREDDIECYYECLVKSIRFKSVAEKFVENKNIKFAVLGHIEYPQYYFFAKAVIAAGGKVYFHWPLVFGTVRVLDSLNCLKNSKNSKFIDHFRNEYLTFLKNNKQDVDSFSSALESNLALSRGYDAEKSSLTNLNKKAFFRSCGVLSDFDHTVVLFSHAHSDAVHSNGKMLFADFAEWLIESIGFFIQQEINVLVKVHPKHLTYDITDLISELRQRFADVSNFGIVSHHISNTVLASYADCFVTVNGSPGLEMAAFGENVVLAGNSRYSGLGIAFEPATCEEYFKIVLDVCHKRQSLPHSRQNALNFLYFESVYSVVDSFSVPDMVTFSADNPIWERLSRQIGFIRHEYDELFVALSLQLKSRKVQFTNPRYLMK